MKATVNTLALPGRGVVLLLCGVCFLGCNPFSDTAPLPETVDYNLHIRPILSDNCFVCHGPDAKERKEDLRLDLAEGAYAALEDYEDRHAIVPGDPAASEVYFRISTDDTSQVMPPPSSYMSLTEREITLIKKWIEQGAVYAPHWALVPPQKAPRPAVKRASWATHDIDYFILDKLAERGLSPNPEADKERLLKRVAFDLTGVPPSLDLQDAFLQDTAPDAYEKVVDALLASPHYGEKMAVHWLDVARYADSHGYQDDGLRTMWPWRDWVIHAFNENYPYDTFLTWQLAGDLLPDKTKEMLLATGFNRNHKITQEGGVIDEEYRIEYVTDRTNTFGKAFLGLTFECAKCHDHKYDPISQRDYYSTFAFFDKVPEKGLYGTIDASFADPPNITITDRDVQDVLAFINKKDTAAVDVMIMQDSVGIRDTYLLARGNYDAKTEVVDFGTPDAVLPFDTTRFEKNRRGLARWLLAPDNPLTARVFVNRIWQAFFGRGLVPTPGDFGMQGALPSHPRLLDWLAVDFRENDWDVKRLVKQIVLSATYRQSAKVTREKLDKDPGNVYLSRAPRTRFNAEMVRDHVLASSGLLNPEIGGPSVKPYQPDGIWEASTSGRGLLQTYVQDQGGDLYRKGMYTFIKRTAPPPAMLMFDASNRDQCEVRRLTTNTPLQALVLLNDPTILEASRVLAERLAAEASSVEEKIAKAFRLILCRHARDPEKVLLRASFEDALNQFTQDPEAAQQIIRVGEHPLMETTDPVLVAALMQVVHTLYNMDEAITKS